MEKTTAGILEKTKEGVFMAKFKRGRQSFILEQAPVITAWASIAGKKESEGPLAHTPCRNKVCRKLYHEIVG